MGTVHIDGSFGEGGGQVLRTGLTLAAITGRGLHIDNIRANRPKPGLGKQHLACVEAACKICNAGCSGDKIGSTKLDFTPGGVAAGNYNFVIGSAGSASLVIQTVLPVLFFADKPSTVTVTGGTHNPWAPPFDFLKESYLPGIAGMGFKADCKLLRFGFYPAGGGEIVFKVQPKRTDEGNPPDLCEPMAGPKISAKIYTSRLPVQIAQKQHKLLLDTGLDFEAIENINVTDSVSAGNCVVVRITDKKRTIVFTGFGSRGKPSEKVINEVVTQARDFLNSGAAIDSHLADQLLIYMAMQRAGKFTTNRLSKHLTTNMEVIKKFLPVSFVVEKEHDYYRVLCTGL
ncbi:MAG: RNA 3'-terminal phosphate cyclase [Sedimentisphaerales bacterium]|nr:RNA 3'-terminal phosphate cyclase [Sedimentisphaerales bacterium]